jgi:hypothetical protein
MELLEWQIEEIDKFSPQMQWLKVKTDELWKNTM